MKITQQQVQFFRQIGYLSIPNLFPENTVEHLRATILAAVEARIQPFTADSDGRIKRISNIIDRDVAFLEALTSPAILDPLECLIGPNIEMIKNRHNHATLNYRDAVPSRLHRDILQWSRSIITIILYLEDSTVETGCTYVVPGSHFLPFVGVTPNHGGTWMDEHETYWDLMHQAVPVPMSAGGLLVIDSLMFHSLGRNSTDKTRISMTAGYHSVDELSGHYDNDRRRLVRGERIYRGNDSYLNNDSNSVQDKVAQ